MKKSEKKLKELTLLLNEEDETIVTGAIDLLRQELPFGGAIALLIQLYDQSTSTSVKKAIELFMNDIKDQSAVIEIITEIKKKWSPETICMLVSSCWQSGLNYDIYTLDFTEVFLEADYATSIECFTVIEETIPSISDEVKEKIRNLVENNINNQSDRKRDLGIELLSIL